MATRSRREAGDRLRRLLAMLPWLAARGGAPTGEVAERFGLSEPEVVGLLEMAACCGLPPYTPDQLMELIVSEGWVTANLGRHLARPQRLTPAEGFALAASARAILSVPGADPEGALARAVDKLDAVLGTRLSVSLDDPPLLGPVREATAKGEVLELAYYAESRDEMTSRQVVPAAVFAREGHWYLDGWCRLAGGRRLFRVDRIRSVGTTGELVARGSSVAGGDRAAGADRVPAAFVPGPETRPVTLVLPPEGRWVAESYPTME
ncbi:MAG: helix-turn-helix transcriptional regulator, partial [Acidimicrobiales bacterium]